MRELLRPRWIIAHIVIITTAAVFVSLGMWQIRRLQQKQDFNARLSARSAEPVVPLTSLFPDAPFDAEQVEAAAYRRVTVTGVYATQDELLLLSRTRNTLAGHHVLTPLVVDPGYAIVVDRGWIPGPQQYELPVAIAEPPAGEVTVTGVLFPSQTRGRFGPRDLPGELDGVWRIDVPRIAQQTGPTLFPLWLHIEAQVPQQTGELPKSIALPTLDEGPHRSYALQWYGFALITLVGYGAIIRKRGRGLPSGHAVPEETPDIE